MPLGDPGFYGTNEDESRNEDYCCYCYAFGKFTEDTTMDEMIGINLEHLEEFNRQAGREFSREKAEEEMRGFFPSLKRWKE